MAAAKLSKSKRFNEVFHILLAHRFPSILRELAFYDRRPRSESKKRSVGFNGAAGPSLALRVRLLMEDLGPSFIKIGQLLGTRPDLVPAEFIEEFKKMYDQTTPTPFAAVRQVVEAELGTPIDRVFLEFEQDPIASAFMAQVHRAKLLTGKGVAVKVQHPGIEARMRTDFEILRAIVNFTERVFAASRVWQPANHVEEIRQMINKELDFRNELRTLSTVGANFADDDSVKIPRVYQEHCTQRLLVMEFVDGIKFRSREQPELVGMDRPRLARIIANAMAKQIFVDRVFHADPSPGNLLIMSSDRICFLDFGAFGHVTKRRARHIFDLIVELNKGSVDGLAKAVLALCDQVGEYEPKRLMTDLEAILDYYEVEKPSPADPVLLEKMLNVAQQHNLLLPADFMLITRALYQFDGMCQELDPEYQLLEVLQPMVGRLARQHFLSPQAQVAMLRDATVDAANLARTLPGQIGRVVSKLEAGELTTRLELAGWASREARRSRMAYFLAFTGLVSALLVGGALVASLSTARALATYVFVAVLVLVLWLIALVIHSSGARPPRG